VFAALALGGAVALAAEGLDRPGQVIAFVSAVLTVALAARCWRFGGAPRGGRERRDRTTRGPECARERDARLTSAETAAPSGSSARPTGSREFDPRLDLVGPFAGSVVCSRGAVQWRSALLAAARLLVGAAFLGCVTDAMLLGHWYLVQRGCHATR